MTFTEYVQMHMNKAYNREDVSVTNTVATNDIAVNSEQYHADPTKWCAKIINNEKFLFFNNHYLNVTKLKDEMKKIYAQNGYSDYGFSKLDESELVRYKTLRDILMGEFLRTDFDNELDAVEAAKIVYQNEMKEFNWQPEEIVVR